MFRDLFDIITDWFQKLASSRLFALAVFFTLMFAVLISKLFQLQIVHGEEYLNNYMLKIEKSVSTSGTRGNIYDRNGNVLAYNELAYSVTIQDTGGYSKSADRNAMLHKLVTLLNEQGEKIEGKFEVAIDANGDMVYTASTETARKRFLLDFYNLKALDELDKAGKNPSNITAREAFEIKKKSYEMDQMKDENGNLLNLSDEILLPMINIRYTMSLTAYRRYEKTTIASYVSDETVAAVSEYSADLLGIGIEESTVRIYENSHYFAPIVGYTGKVQEDQLEELKKISESYNASDIVGRTGIEASMEAVLQGKKGSKTMYVDSLGRIMKTTNQVDPQAGNNIYLTIDQNLQIGVYNLIEQQLAGILASKLVNQDVDLSTETDSTELMIPIKDAYFQLINNNILSLKRMSAADASDIERQIHQKYLSSRDQIFSRMRHELESEHPTAMKDLPKDMYAYMQYIFTFLSDSMVGIVQKDKIDTTSDEYLAWKNDTISLRDYLYYGIASSWLDTTKLETSSKYSNADSIYTTLINYVMEQLADDSKFTKRMYRYLVNDEIVTGRELCLALYAQEILPYDEEQINQLSSNGENYAYTFMINKISNIDLTPAQLALDPYSGSCVITNVNTGEVLALVTYPSYDNNRFSGSVDGTYLNQLNEDLSLPLWNNATQVVKAPGSTFKPITAIAGLEEYAINLTDTIQCTGIYEEVDPAIRCWIHPGYHGPLNIVGGIQNSCNYFFAELAHRIATDKDGNYSANRGIEIIRKYATMFGLDHTSGIEIPESEPQLTTEDPERSSMGQGTNAYSNVQLSRYVAALASRGDVFELSLLDKRTDAEGNLLEDYTPKVSSHINIADTTWNAVHTGMREVIASGSARNIFKDLEVDIAGKTGTAQETRNRANHGFFISFAPYANPEIGVTVNIPYGYSSSNAATIAKNVYRFYYGYTDLDYILNTGALDVTNVRIRD